jgi:hypothetical protein
MTDEQISNDVFFRSGFWEFMGHGKEGNGGVCRRGKCVFADGRSCNAHLIGVDESMKSCMGIIASIAGLDTNFSPNAKRTSQSFNRG